MKPKRIKTNQSFIPYSKMAETTTTVEIMKYTEVRSAMFVSLESRFLNDVILPLYTSPIIGSVFKSFSYTIIFWIISLLSSHDSPQTMTSAEKKEPLLAKSLYKLTRTGYMTNQRTK